MKTKKIVLIASAVMFALVVIISLILWDPADLFRLRQVDRAEGTYRIESFETDGVDFTVDELKFTGGDAVVVLSDGSMHNIESVTVSGNLTFFSFDYGQINCTLYCMRKSDKFRLVGASDCDYLLCNLYIFEEDEEKSVVNFNARRK